MKRNEIIDEYNNALTKLALYEYVEEEGNKILKSLPEFDTYRTNKRHNVKYTLVNLVNKLKGFFKKTYILMPRICTVLLALIVISVFGVMSSADAMENIGRMLIEKSQTSLNVSVEGDGSGQANIVEQNEFYTPTVAVTGFVFTSLQISAGAITISYVGKQKENGDMNEYQYSYYADAFAVKMYVGRTQTTTQFSKNGREYIVNETDKGIFLVVSDIRGVFFIKGDITREEALKVFDSAIKNKLVIGIPVGGVE